MLISFVLPCLIVAGTLSSSNGSLVRLAGSFGTIAQKFNWSTQSRNRVQDLGNRQATTFEEENSHSDRDEDAGQYSRRKIGRHVCREDPQLLGWNRCSRPVFKVRTTARCTTLERSINAARSSYNSCTDCRTFYVWIKVLLVLHHVWYATRSTQRRSHHPLDERLGRRR